MQYAIIETDIGQGTGAVALPISYGKPLETLDTNRPHTVAEVLQTFYGADFGTVLDNYVRMEHEKIQNAEFLKSADRIRVRAWTYWKTLSKIQQPTDRTVVDVILQSKLEGEYSNGERKQERGNRHE